VHPGDVSRPPSAARSQAAITPLGDVVPGTSEALRVALLRACSNFRTYRDHFAEAGLSEHDLRSGDPAEALRHLPLMQPSMLDALADESIEGSEGIVDMEASSGTTGKPKRRIVTAEDERSETELLARLFAICGIGPRDRVACVDTGPLTLMASFTGALEQLGVAEAYAYSVSPDVEATVDGLIALDPTVIITIPSIVERYLDALTTGMARAAPGALSKVVYAGEPLAAATRSRLEGGLGVQVFAYYGASETSALGIECGRHTGIHLLADRHFLELADAEDRGNEADLVVTTLHQRGLPLVRYPLGDVVRLRSGHCPCGLGLPLVDVLGRHDATASVLGTKVAYASLLDDVYRDVAEPREMEIVLARNATEVMTLRLPARLRDAEPAIRKAVLRREPELAFLVGSGFLAIDFEFVDDGHFDASRKRRSIVDRREERVGLA
jgi:phenylacetate-CoA ligase